MYRIYSLISCCLFFVSCQNLREGSECTVGGYKGRCVLYKRCLSLIQDRDDKKQPQICFMEGRKPVVCCTDCELVEDIDNMVVDPQIGYRYKDGSKAWDYCLDSFKSLPYACKEHYSYRLEKSWDEEKQCHGVRFTAVGAAGGEDATRGEYPHMGLLGYGDTEQLQWLCGGSLISSHYVLTAAHCSASATQGPAKYVALGILRRSDPEDLWQMYKIEAVIVHPEYAAPAKYHDIALIKTEKRVKFTQFVLPACLHSRDTLESGWDYAHATGWGNLGRREGPADTLQKVLVRRFNTSECSGQYPPHRLLSRGFDPSTQICYGHRQEVKDTCSGDSGGPLSIKSGCMYDVLGVTSYGKECGIAGQAGIYTRVEHYVPWIESIVWP